MLPEYNRDVILRIRHFIVEDVRSARRFLKRVEPSIDIDALRFYVLDKFVLPGQAAGYLAPLDDGEHVGVLSEAGCPAVADPGADVVAIAQRKNHPVAPLVGPSSVLLSLMASGFNGQNFAFNGYLPVDPAERAGALRKLERRVYAEDQTQLFIETPYRNNRLVDDVLRVCRPSTRLCIARDITCEGESIRTHTVEAWAGRTPDLSKKPAIFLIYK